MGAAIEALKSRRGMSERRLQLKIFLSEANHLYGKTVLINAMKELSLYETIFLLAVLRLPGNAYGVTIRSEVAGISGRKIPYGTLYSYLDQLFNKGYVVKAFGAPTTERGGRSKILYQVTPAGRAALKEAYQLQRTINLGLEKIIKAKS
jgi:DNA-binding PadR family transcriptional regulator